MEWERGAKWIREARERCRVMRMAVEAENGNGMWESWRMGRRRVRERCFVMPMCPASKNGNGM